MPRAPQDTYARLLSSPRGYPLWTPEPSNELLMERRDGLRIGDVGVVLDDGGFDILFNICLPAEHPFHRRHGVPDGFTCIDPRQLDIRTTPNAERPGRIISTSSVTRVDTVELSNDASERFNLSSSEGALLILPKGAQQSDLLNENLFLEQASRHGAEWYNYAVNRRHRIISPDSLYLITGIHKTCSWSVAAFENVTANEHHTAHFKQIEADSGTAPSYSWETTCALDWRVGPHIDYGVPNQSVFIRGFKIAIRSGFLGTRWISVEADVPSTRLNPVKSTSIVPSNSPVFDTLAGLLGRSGNNFFQATKHSERMAEERPESSKVPNDSGYDGMHIEIQRIPDASPVFHPSDAINQYLLRQDPSANIAITHDSHWISLLEDESLSPEELAQEFRLETALSRDYRAVSREGVVYLERKPPQPTDTRPPPATESSTSNLSESRPCHPADDEVPPPERYSETLLDRTQIDDQSRSYFHEPWDATDPILNLPGPSTPNYLPQWNTMTLHTDHSWFDLPLLASPLICGTTDGSIQQPVYASASALADPDLLRSWSDPGPIGRQNNDSMDIIANDPERGRIRCRWLTDRMLCDITVPQQELVTHLRGVHGVSGARHGTMIRCQWDGCNREFPGHCLIPHICENHAYPAECPASGAVFTHRAMDAHHASCTRGRQR